MLIIFFVHRIEVFCGKKQDAQFIDTQSGPAAVIRNLKAVWPAGQVNYRKKRIVVTDREYTSVALAYRLLNMGYYTVGTVQPDRKGFCKQIKFKKPRNKPAGIQRGFYRLARNKAIPHMYTTVWVDSKVVHFVSTGISAKPTAVRRKLKSGDKVDVACPELVDVYNKYMAGVDSHDQLRLQRWVQVQVC
jgi:hypothetical protein